MASSCADGSIAQGETIIVATGAQYRQPAARESADASPVSASTTPQRISKRKLCRDEDIIVVGGGNSAGQAAVFLAGTCRHVHIMVRSAGLAESMSHYLIRRIEETPNITLHTHTELTDARGQ